MIALQFELTTVNQSPLNSRKNLRRIIMSHKKMEESTDYFSYMSRFLFFQKKFQTDSMGPQIASNVLQTPSSEQQTPATPQNQGKKSDIVE
ncbi:hypothetical protein CEXT_348921 [Caerostris extrusa]|uniref:Uncharacterized protein n=1 Tax=Caerostris extrusa TaxID=172846 RepID=A0AAV4XT15_CAEEX|nr:hypothetical protein CEXT_348921 [Caerostris extrusa]